MEEIQTVICAWCRQLRPCRIEPKEQSAICRDCAKSLVSEWGVAEFADAYVGPLLPPEIAQDGFGFFVRRADGIRVCEDCLQPIPPYVDFPVGLVSPESDGDAGGNFAKRRPYSVEGKVGIEALRKAVCLPCYLTAFERVYPGQLKPDLNSACHERQVFEPPPPSMESVGDPLQKRA